MQQSLCSALEQCWLLYQLQGAAEELFQWECSSVLLCLRFRAVSPSACPGVGLCWLHPSCQRAVGLQQCLAVAGMYLQGAWGLGGAAMGSSLHVPGHAKKLFLATTWCCRFGRGWSLQARPSRRIRSSLFSGEAVTCVLGLRLERGR